MSGTRRIAVVAWYCALVGAWLVLRSERDLPGAVIVAICLVPALLLGFEAARWWAVFLPFTVVLLELFPPTSRSTDGDVPSWFLAFFAAMLWTVVVVVGALVRQWMERRRLRQG